jgi:hypothetical protein
MDMPLPDNTARMMGGEDPFGSVEMGGMFSVVKVRRDQPRGDYRDPGWYAHPPGQAAYEWTGSLPEPARFGAEGGRSMPPAKAGQGGRAIEVLITAVLSLPGLAWAASAHSRSGAARCGQGRRTRSASAPSAARARCG